LPQHHHIVQAQHMQAAIAIDPTAEKDCSKGAPSSKGSPSGLVVVVDDVVVEEVVVEAVDVEVADAVVVVVGRITTLPSLIRDVMETSSTDTSKTV